MSEERVQSIITSDCHLGSRYFMAEQFIEFINSLPKDADLILNGDVVDRHEHTLSGTHAAAMQALIKESHNRKIVWVRGNHDEQYTPPDFGEIEFCWEYHIGTRLLVAHGNHFDNVMPHHRMFIYIFRFFHVLRLLLGAEAVHVAHYAKRFHRLYAVLRRHVMLNAVQHARENGYTAVTCGHTHFAEEKMCDGIRYYNTGSWTEPPPSYLKVGQNDISLVTFRPSPTNDT